MALSPDRKAIRRVERAERLAALREGRRQTASRIPAGRGRGAPYRRRPKHRDQENDR